MTITRIERRGLSYLIDYAIAFVISVLIVLFSNIFDFIDLPFTSNVTHVLSSTFIIYFVISFISLKLFNGVTIGRAITKLRVVSLDGTSLRLGQIVIRSLTESLLILAFINCFYIFYYKNGTTFFDRVSDTRIK